jgi:hypothetical protein
MFENLATLLLLVLGMVMLGNYRKGTLGQWFGAKFLGRAS